MAVYVSRLTELRKNKNLTQRQLADLVGVDPSTIRNWERNRGGIEVFVRIAKLCEVLDCNPHDLYSEDNFD
jgi:transcriptional regulator with XRE-family HTH domain